MKMLRFEIKKVFSKTKNRITIIVLLVILIATSILTINRVEYVDESGNHLTGISAAKNLREAKNEWSGYLTEDVFQKDIEEEYSIRPSTATELLKQMEKNGLIVREPVSYDNRLKRIVVTEKALQYRQQVVEDLTALEETLTRGISETDLQIFFQVIEKMMDNLAE